MEFTEQQAFEALGIEPEKPDEGAQEREVADPAPKEETAAQVPAAEADTGEGADQGEAHRELDPGEGSDEPGSAAQEGDKLVMTPEQRKEAAAQRRRQEQQAAIDDAVNKAMQAEREKSREEMENFFKAAQLKNSITGEAITSMEEFRAWKQAFDAAQLQKDLKAGRLTPESFEKAISELPAVKRLEGIAQKQEQARQEKDMAAAKAKVEGELAEIHKLDPSISTVEDLLKMPKAKEFYALVKAGNSFLNAYRLSHFEELQTKAVEAAKQKALNDTRGKDHLAATAKGRGVGAVSVPDEEMKLFRLLNPGTSEAEIQAYYNKTKNP